MEHIDSLRVHVLVDCGGWSGILIGSVSEAFLILKVQQEGVPIALTPLFVVAMNAVYAASAYPFGRLSDSMTHGSLLMFGLVVLVGADLLLALHGSWEIVLLGMGLWGLHMGMTQGLLAAMVAHAAPADLRGTAFGFFNLVGGLATLLANVLAGFLWDRSGASFTFYAGATFAGIAMLAIVVFPLMHKAR